MNIHSLQSLFCQRVSEHSSSFEKGVDRFFRFQEYPSNGFLENECVWEEPLFSEDVAIKNWKQLLALNLLCDLAQLDSSFIASQVRLFERKPWNQSSQYFRSIVALNHAFAKMLTPEVGPHLLESGAALIDVYEYTPWLSLPYNPQHFEFGIFLAILGILKEKQELKKTVVKLAKWQMNTLDIHGYPLKGLFVREKESQFPRSQCLSYLLFRVASLCTNEYPFSEYADAALKSLFDSSEYSNEVISPLWPLIEKWCESFTSKDCTKETLSEYIYDPSTSLVGFRTLSEQIMCTLHGGKTGLGSIRKEDVEIVSYGPQYFPLADCEGFGIQGNALSDQGMRRTLIEWRPQSFSIKGCVRMVDEPAHSEFGFGKYRGIWLEVVQEYKRPLFSLKTTFLGLNGWDSVVFSFFVKAMQCVVGSDKILQPQTLEHYEGDIQPIFFQGKEIKVGLDAIEHKGKLQVIPLSGGHNFWGANFLVAYHLTNEQSHYEWQVK